MNRISMVTGLFLSVFLSLPAIADGSFLILPDQLKWSAPPALMEGAESAVVAGDPAGEGPYVLRLKLPAGFKILPHTHPNVENATVLSGMLHTGMGETFDEAAKQAVGPGGFVRRPAGMAHFIWVSEDTLLQLHSIGPGGITYVNPADDPRKE